MNFSPFLSIDRPCHEALQWTSQQLTKTGLRPVQTFDLSAARLGMPDCACPHHGTDQCDCQLVVLLVYGKTGEPSTLILHGNNGQTWISLAEGTVQGTNTQLCIQIKRILEQNSSPVA